MFRLRSLILPPALEPLFNAASTRHPGPGVLAGIAANISFELGSYSPVLV